MTGPMQSGDHAGPRRAWVNLFEITNQAELSIDYRLVEIRGLPRGEYYDKQINQLVKMIARECRQPVALVRRDGAHLLALPAKASSPHLEYRLTPHVATLVPGGEIHSLDLGHLDEETAPIGVAFLRFSLQTPLWEERRLWGSGRAYYGKHALNAADAAANVDIYPGFVWNVAAKDGRLFLSVDALARYVDRRWLTERINGGDPHRYLRRHCLYHFGHQWYVVQIWGVSALCIAEQRFVPNGVGEVTDVFSYTKERWRADTPAWVDDLDPRGPAVLYRYPGRREDRHGALALCKLVVPTADAEAAGLHRRSILDPAARFDRIRHIVANYFQSGRLAAQPIRVATAPLEIERRVFPIPPQRFGHGRKLAISLPTREPGTDLVPIEHFGARRLSLLLDPQVGPLDTTPFDAQYLFLPESAPRAVNEDFEARFLQAMRDVSGQKDYTSRRILYDDRQATSLYRQVQAIKQAIAENRITRGYPILVLPDRAKSDLHNYVKRALWPHLQFQCAKAGKIRSFYERCADEPSFRPIPDRTSRLDSYVRNCAFGMMVVNRKWAWTLAEPLHYEVYIGVDVLNRMAGFTFVYNHAEQILFRDYPCKQKERLTAAQVRDVLVKHLREDLTTLGLRPRSLVIHRDGRTFSSELEGLHAAIDALKREGILPRDVVVGVVDIRKTFADNLRLVEGGSIDAVQNPTVGSAYYEPGAREGIVCTTGRPFRFPGTAKPLAALIVEGPLEIDKVLEDIFALSQPVFTAPDKCARLPLTIKLADDFLEPIAADADEEEALYDTDTAEIMEPVDDQALTEAMGPQPGDRGSI